MVIGLQLTCVAVFSFQLCINTKLDANSTGHVALFNDVLTLSALKHHMPNNSYSQTATSELTFESERGMIVSSRL
jgi:hypothetical protein